MNDDNEKVNSIGDLYDDLVDNSSSQVINTDNTSQSVVTVDDDVEPEIELTQDNMTDILLSLNGYPDKNKIEIVDNETNQTIVVPFDELDTDTKLSLLTTSPSDILHQDEQALINILRDNNISINDYIELAINNYVSNMSNEQEQIVSVDDCSDEEIYFNYLVNSFPSKSEESLKRELEEDMAREGFEEKVADLRAQRLEEEVALQREEMERQESELRENKEKGMKIIENSLLNTDDIFDVISLDNNDKNDIYNYMVVENITGQTQFQIDLKDPKKLVLAAWAMTKGKDAFDMVRNAYKQQPAKHITTQTKVIKSVVDKKPDNDVTTLADLYS